MYKLRGEEADEEEEAMGQHNEGEKGCLWDVITLQWHCLPLPVAVPVAFFFIS